MDAAAAVVDCMERRTRHPRTAGSLTQGKALRLARENTRLAREIRALREANADLLASAEVWIRLYEAALERCRGQQPSGTAGANGMAPLQARGDEHRVRRREALPILPAGWAPLTGDEQRHLLDACDAAPENIVFCLTSPSADGREYRAYRLTADGWAGLWVAGAWVSGPEAGPAARLLLAVHTDARRVVQVALEQFCADPDERPIERATAAGRRGA